MENGLELRESLVHTYLNELEAVDPAAITPDDQNCPLCYEKYGEGDWDFEDMKGSDSLATLRELPFAERTPNHDPVRTVCGHMFGRHCLIQSMTHTGRSCPLCRSNLQVGAYRSVLTAKYERFAGRDASTLWEKLGSPLLFEGQLVILPRSFREGFRLAWTAQMRRFPLNFHHELEFEYDVVAQVMSSLFYRYAFAWPLAIDKDGLKAEVYHGRRPYSAPVLLYEFAREAVEDLERSRGSLDGWLQLLVMLSLEHLFKLKALEQHFTDAGTLLDYEIEDPASSEAHKDNVGAALSTYYRSRWIPLDPMWQELVGIHSAANLMMYWWHQAQYYESMRVCVNSAMDDAQDWGNWDAVKQLWQLACRIQDTLGKCHGRLQKNQNRVSKEKAKASRLWTTVPKPVSHHGDVNGGRSQNAAG
ncbi:hypothetical protein K491DRAFT_714675 [Lophiostoma macrostomum CBS 122681]|uniref:RING-type domain-containing protein n=1 Tax=Lophiostoma macrostomum CBS 122681 TaxID=1314788 RepID=A0A6A6TBV9_9PLEO|nr:hypothetical protein K491DRAFT_714675 [Lophiostoma macrostomum CBS 122681]